MKNRVVVALAAAMTVGAVHAAGPAEIALVRGGKTYELSDAARARIGEELPKLFATCSLNSREHPKIFAATDAGAMWQATLAKDHLRVRLAAPVNVGHAHQRALPARELLLGLNDPRFPWPELSRDGESVVAHSKCSGGDIIKFVCAPELKPLMPESYHRLCSVLS
jgi:hypothetical protein